MRRRCFQSGCTLVFAVMALDSSTWLSFAFFQEGRLKSVFVSAEIGKLIGLAEFKSKF